MNTEQLMADGEYLCAGLFEEPERSLFYRKSLGIRRFLENSPLPEYDKTKRLYPSGKQGAFPYSYTNLLWGQENRIKDKDMAKKYREDFLQGYVIGIPVEHRVAGLMWVHSMPYYERILREGFLSYIPRIEKIADMDMREGLLHLVEGLRAYSERCVKYLRDEGAPEELVSALEKIPMRPAENIFDAIEGWNFIMYLDCCDNLGCLADGLLPYYKGEDIVPLIGELYDNLDINEGYSMSLGLNGYHPMVYQCLKALAGKRRPMTELFVGKDTPDDIWELAFETIRSGGGQPAFYNKIDLPRILMDRLPSKTKEDMKRFCGGGCTESMIAGMSNVGSIDAGLNLPLLLEKTICSSLPGAKDFEEFYRAFIDLVRETALIVTRDVSASQLRRAEVLPVPLRTLLIDDCIDNGVEYYRGGARYKWSIINFAGNINVVDSMLTIKDMIFDRKVITPEEMISKLRNNDKEFLAECRKEPLCFGTCDSEVNKFAHRLTNDIYSTLDDLKPAIGEAFIPASIQFESHAKAGRDVGATPDGREAYSPLCDSLGAIFGKDRSGPTALLGSVTSLALDKLCGTPVLNFNLTSKFNDATLRALILGYMEMGGIQMQVSCASRETLLDAMEHPELHRNLIVRVGGYSEYFNRLTDDMKRMIIDRSIQEV